MANIDHGTRLTCRVVRPQVELVGKQGHLSAPAISAQSVGARRMHLQIVRIPPSVSAKTHKHRGHETALWHVVWREARTASLRKGWRLSLHPVQPYNLSDVESCTALVARTDPNEQESIVLLPELDRQLSTSLEGASRQRLIGQRFIDCGIRTHRSRAARK
jgi:uncharacterized RmlC-like cupin family protein